MSVIRFARVFLLLASFLLFACSEPSKEDHDDTLPEEIPSSSAKQAAP
jgi:outer membrane biogenesis lipoprotein LolB